MTEKKELTFHDINSYILKYFFIKNGELHRSDRKNSLGSFDKDGYKIVKIKGKQYKEHRLVWFLYHGRFPKKEIDHINRIRNDNRIENLREVTREENIKNTVKKINKDTGVYGVYVDKTTKGLKSKYTFHFKKKTYRFLTLDQAIQKRKQLSI